MATTIIILSLHEPICVSVWDVLFHFVDGRNSLWQITVSIYLIDSILFKIFGIEFRRREPKEKERNVQLLEAQMTRVDVFLSSALLSCLQDIKFVVFFSLVVFGCLIDFSPKIDNEFQVSPSSSKSSCRHLRVPIWNWIRKFLFEFVGAVDAMQTRHLKSSLAITYCVWVWISIRNCLLLSSAPSLSSFDWGSKHT